jgi:hypothetical protein
VIVYELRTRMMSRISYDIIDYRFHWCNCGERVLPSKPRRCLVVLSRSVCQHKRNMNESMKQA